MAGNSEVIVRQLLEKADVQIDGNRQWDIKIHNDGFYERVLAHGSLGLGEAYMDGWWDCDAIDQLIFKIMRAELYTHVHNDVHTILTYLLAKIRNPQTKARSKKVAEVHYNLGNDFYQKMLDPYMQYSCSYFKDTDNLATAQEQKLDLICRKLQLKPTDHVLDIGCGWGGLAKFMSEKYGCRVTGVTIAEEQVKLAQEMTKGLPIEILLKDYRDLTQQFDKVVSVGMFEHVGAKNYKTYMQTVKRCLKKDGTFLLHSIGQSYPYPPDAWFDKYIFPNSMLPAVQQVTDAAARDFVLEDWHNFGQYYDPTLMAWHKNFETHWSEFKDHYGDRFYRMWRYYLLSCAGSFRARSIQLWQIAFTHQGMVGGFPAVR